MRPTIFGRPEDQQEFAGMGATGAFLEMLCDGARHCNHDTDCLAGALTAVTEHARDLLTRFQASGGPRAEAALASFAWMLELHGSHSLPFIEHALQPVCGGCFAKGACREAIGWDWMIENAMKACIDVESGSKIVLAAGSDEHGPYLQVSLVPASGEESWLRYHADPDLLAATREELDPARILEILEPVALRVAGRIGGRASNKALYHAEVERTRDLHPWDVFYNRLRELTAA